MSRLVIQTQSESLTIQTMGLAFPLTSSSLLYNKYNAIRAATELNNKIAHINNTADVTAPPGEAPGNIIT